MSSAPDAAVAFVIFNRPSLTARVFAAIRRARPRQLFVVGDGPRPDHPEDAELVREAQRVIEGVDWPCEVHTNYSSENLGCKRRVTSGLDWVFSNVDTAIILEDDCLPEPTFFPFCNELLDRYRDVRQVHLVSGCNVLYPKRFSPHSYYFSHCYHIWGWATWARAWALYDIEMTAWPEVRQSDWLERHLGNATAAEVARLIFDDTYEGMDVWDFQFVLQSWLADGMSITPTVNQITNLGFGAMATHEQAVNHPFANMPTAPLSFPLEHPAQLATLDAADNAEWELAYPDFFHHATPTIKRRLRHALRMATPLRSRARGRSRFG